MGRWSRIVALSTVALASPAFAQGPASMMGGGGGHTAGGHMRGGYMGGNHVGGGPISGPGTVPNPGQLRVPTRSGPGTVPNPGQTPSHPFDGTPGGFPYRDHHRGGILVGGETGFTTYGGAILPDEAPYDDGGPPPPYVIPAPPAPCAPHPLIIKVGRGVTHHAKPRLTYGLPPCGTPYP